MKVVRSKLTYANVMATIAVFLVLAGGSAYAASHLGRKSVGTNQLKTGAVTGPKIKNGAVDGSKIQEGSITVNDLSVKPPAPVPPRTSPLQPGETITGYLSIDQGTSERLLTLSTAASFQIPLGHPIPGSHRHFLGYVTEPPTCPGPGKAAQGQLCVYQMGSNVNVHEVRLFGDESGEYEASLYGFLVEVEAEKLGSVYFDASWAYTEGPG